jgi:hypothetical protein
MKKEKRENMFDFSLFIWVFFMFCSESEIFSRFSHYSLEENSCADLSQLSLNRTREFILNAVEHFFSFFFGTQYWREPDQNQVDTFISK